MRTGQCRICHSREVINRNNLVRTHRNKYIRARCDGSFRPCISGTEQPIAEQPADYDKEDISDEPSGISGSITLYLGGLLTGIIAGYFIF